MGTPFWQAYEQFHLRCDSQNLSPGTMLWYRQIARGLERFLVQSRAPDDVETIAARHIRGYFSALRSGGMSSETAHRYYGGLRCLFKFWRREGILKDNPMELVEKPRRERHMIRPLTPEQVHSLLEQVGAADFLSLRNRALMLLMLDSGLRLTEALTLRLNHLDLEGGTALVMGKGRKESTLRQRRAPSA